MKKLLLLILIPLPFFTYGQIITTIAGNNTAANTGDGGQADAASIDYPLFGAFDKEGNYIFSTGGHTVRRISVTGIISTIAEINGVNKSTGDGGTADTATLSHPEGIAIDSLGNIFIANEGNSTIRRIDHATNIITTIAGNDTAGYSGDGGPAVNASLNEPFGICLDKADNLYIADWANSRIRKIDTAGIITTFAGTGTGGFNGETGLADTTEIRRTYDICADPNGNIYIADGNNSILRKVDLTGMISTVGGDRIGSLGSFSGAGGLAVDAYFTPQYVSCDRYGNIYVSDVSHDILCEINTAGYLEVVAGTGSNGFSGDSSIATMAKINGPGKAAFDSCDNLYFADINNYRIRKITYSKCDYLTVNNVVNQPRLSIYPDPATDFLNIDHVASASSYQLLNMIGATVQKGNVHEGNNSISLQLLPSGMYMLQLTDDDGKKSIMKVLKQ